MEAYSPTSWSTPDDLAELAADKLDLLGVMWLGLHASPAPSSSNRLNRPGQLYALLLSLTSEYSLLPMLRIENDAA